MLTKLAPAAGRILISEPFLADPNFVRSVVLLAEHSAAGAFGFTLNEESNLLLNDVVPDLFNQALTVYIGGPVGLDTLHFIHRSETLGDGIPLGNGLFWGGNLETVRILLDSGQLVPEDIRFFVGYSGWSAGQLEDEITENTWIVSELTNAEFVFKEGDVWKAAITEMGPKHAHVVNFPINPQLN